MEENNKTEMLYGELQRKDLENISQIGVKFPKIVLLYERLRVMHIYGNGLLST
jgi:hypothetical protein